MKLLWRNSWIEAPRPHPVPGSTLVEVDATVAIAAVGAAHGRRIESPARKVASFTITDGPAATLRKARSKRAEPAYSGDYHLVAVLGRAAPGEGLAAEGARIVALAPRSTPCASWMLVPAALARPAPDGFDAEALSRLAAAVAPDAAAIPELLGQSYLYSAMEPPAELAALLERGLAAAGSSPRRAEPILTPPADAGTAEVVLDGNRPDAPGPPLAVLGAGDYVRIEVAPALRRSHLRRAVLADREPQIAALAAAELGFERATTDAVAAIDCLTERGIVIVATAHDSHAFLSARALAAGHRVLCEKPAVVDAADLDLLSATADAHPGELEVGFNRRHNPLVERVRLDLARESGPTTIVASIREVDITPDHWYLWPNQGTRVAGNLCHWIDLAIHLLGPGPEATSVSVSPRVSADPTGLDAERTFSIAFDDGSTVTLVPTGRGDSIRGVQEQIEARRGRLTLHLDDLWRLRGLASGRPIRGRTLWRDKGHGRMYGEALARFESGQPAAYPPDDLRRVGEIQIAATELLLAGEAGGSISSLVERSRARA